MDNPLGEFALVCLALAIPHADDWGRVTGNARQFRMLIYPSSDRSIQEFDDALSALEAAGFWVRYQYLDRAGTIQKALAFPQEDWWREQSYIPKRKREKDESLIPPQITAEAATANPPTPQITAEAATANPPTPQITAEAATANPPTPQITAEAATANPPTPQITASPSPSPSPSVSSKRAQAPKKPRKLTFVQQCVKDVQAVYAQRGLALPTPSIITIWRQNANDQIDALVERLGQLDDTKLMSTQYVFGLSKGIGNDPTGTLIPADRVLDREGDVAVVG